MPQKKEKKEKLDKNALICSVVERLVCSSTTWSVLIEEVTWPEKVFLLQQKPKIDRIISDYKSLTGRN